MSTFFMILTLPITLPVMFMAYVAGMVKTAAIEGWNAAE